MHQIRIFKSVETELSALEREVNAWLKGNNIRVVNIFGNIAPQTVREGRGLDRQFNASDVLLTVVYEAD